MADKVNNSLNTLILYVVVFVMIAYSGLYYAKYLYIVWVAYGLLVLTAVINIISYKKIVNVGFIIYSTIVILYCYISSIWAYSSFRVLDATKLLFNIYIVAILLSTLLKNRRTIQYALLGLSIGGLLYGVIYVQHVNIASLSYQRLSFVGDSSGGLPNLNVVTMGLSFSCIYFIYQFLFGVIKKNVRILLCMTIIVSVVLLCILGSRKSLLTVVIAIALFFFNSKFKTKFKIIIGLFLLLNVILIFIPESYIQFVVDRFAVLGSGQSSLDRSDQARMWMIESGFNFFTENPVIGNGFYNFSELFGIETGRYVYAHNNFIEVLCDLGIIGFVIYYYIFYLIIKNVIGANIYKQDKILVISLVIAILINGMVIVYLLDRYVWLLLAILYAYSKNLKKQIGLCQR